jgi:hypothetical protein
MPRWTDGRTDRHTIAFVQHACMPFRATARRWRCALRALSASPSPCTSDVDDQTLRLVIYRPPHRPVVRRLSVYSSILRLTVRPSVRLSTLSGRFRPTFTFAVAEPSLSCQSPHRFGQLPPCSRLTDGAIVCNATPLESRRDETGRC